ncbi:MAG: hypothetical protein LBD24_02185, partial [Spirochaetaceae bacterium]|nr:hypothetical protein [Spirochaetaceae bacterium]
ETNVFKLETNVSRLETNVFKLETNVSRLETNVSRLETNVSRLETNVSKSETNVFKLETFVGAAGRLPRTTTRRSQTVRCCAKRSRASTATSEVNGHGVAPFGNNTRPC